MWSVFPIYTKKSNFWALEQALIQLWQPQLNTPFIYQFFNCRKGLIPRTKFSSSRQFGFYSFWRKLRWKSTPAQVRRALHSPIFGRRVQLWEIIQDLGSNSVQTISHGEATSLQRDRPTRMLLHSTTCQQPWRTSTFLCHQCHRSSPDLLESQTSPQTRSASSTLAPGYRLDSSSTTTSYHPRTPDQAVQHHSSDSFHRHCIHQIFPRSWTAYAITKKQLLGGQTARLRCVHVQLSDNIHLYLIKPTNISFLMETIYDSPMHFYIYCYGLTSKQDLSTIQRDLQFPPFCSDDMDYEEFTPITTKSTSRRSLAKVYPISQLLTPKPHYPQGHYTLQATFPRGHLSQ